MLAPLLFVWPLSIAFTHYFASNVANFPYDQALREHVNAIARQVKLVDGKQVTVFHEGILPWALRNPTAIVFD